MGNGFNWLVEAWPYLVEETDGTIVVARGTRYALWFDFDDQTGNYTARYGAKSTLTHAGSVFTLAQPSGERWTFHDFTQTSDPQGLFASHVAPGGQTTVATAYTTEQRIEALERSVTVASVTTTEQFLYAHDAETGRVESVTLRRKVGAGSWIDVRRALYGYYGESDPNGSPGDLRHVRVQAPSGGWQDVDQSHYRYWKSGDPQGFAHGLKFAVGPEAYARMEADSLNPLTASNAQIALYADHYFEYDGEQRVTKEIVLGGALTFLFAYITSSNSAAYNHWAVKTVETLPDGNTVTVYTNHIGQVLLKKLAAGSDTWLEYHKYDGEGREILSAEPSAITGFDDTEPDLDVTLKSTDGLIHVTDYYATTGSGAAKGYVQFQKIKRGGNGTEIKLRALEYATRTAGGNTVHPPSKQIAYRNDDNTGAIETAFSYTWHSGTVQMEEAVTTLPAVPTSQNGSGVAATRKDYFDAHGYRTWGMDERGYITNLTYDVPTGAVTQRIDDVDTGEVSGAPSGWTTPTGGGLNLVTDYQHDDLGRTTQELGPEHTIDIGGTATVVRRATWMVYHDAAHEVWTGQGYQKVSDSSFTLINPVSIVKRDARGNVLEQIQATRASTSGKLLPTDSFAQSSYVRWTTYQYTECCILASVRVYHDIPSSGSGTEGTNYDETRYGYNSMRVRNRTVSPGGTITFNVLDARQQVIETWVGTNDDGATESDPTGGGADPDNNMVIVTANEYDDGNDGGDGNLTEQTQHVDGSTTRVTGFVFDWRDRRVDVDGEIDLFQRSYHDNLNRVVEVERYDTTDSGNLVARSETKFDDRGQIYRTIQFEVDPDTGTVGGSLAENTWFDDAGNVVKREPAGLMDWIELAYDSLSRLVGQTDALNGETVFGYDDASNRTSLTDAEDNTTTWGYSGIGQVVKETDPLDDDRTFAYDDAGMLSVRTDRDGRVIEFDYDDAARKTEERWKEGGNTVNTLQYTYDADGRLVTAGDDDSAYAYQYDLNGGMTEVDNDGTPGMPRVVLSAEYNRQVERTSLGATVASTNDFLNSYSYDALARTSRIDQDANGGNSVAEKRVDFAYDVRGGYATIDRYANVSGSSLVAKSTFGYDDYARLTSIEHAKGATSLASHAYTFNAARLIDQHTTVDGDSDYSYDDDAQLTEALHSFQSNESYSYDSTGNRTNTGYSTGDGNRLLSDGTYDYEYDAEGNRTKRTTIATNETVEYAWDHRNRLTSVTFKNSSGVKTKQIDCVYDVHNRRIAKLLDDNGNGTVDAEWRFVYDPMVRPALADVVLVFDGSGNLRNRYLHGPDVDQVLAGEDSAGDVLWQLTDHLGTVRDLAEYDSQADSTSVVNHVKYDAFGAITGQSDSTKTPLYAFTGRGWDPDAGLYYYRARWYDAVVGRFLSEDPVGFEAEDANLYRYVGNSPVMLNDPSGNIDVSSIAIYGRYCGPINSEPQPPIDRLDAACRSHDQCLATTSDWLNPARVILCDRIFCKQVREAVAKGVCNRYPDKIDRLACRAQAEAIETYACRKRPIGQFLITLCL